MWGILKRLLGAPSARQGDGVSSALALRPGNSGRNAHTPPTIDIASLSYVPLPRAPLQWEVHRDEPDTPAEATAEFEVRDAAWKVLSTDKIPMTDRPDPAFRQLYPTDSGVFMLDDLGNAKGIGTIESAALRYDREGRVQAKKGFGHDIYRTGVHPLGNGFVVMSRECSLFAYDESLAPIFVRNLRDFPNISELQGKFSLSDDQVKNHIRCVALSKGEDRYLFTVVDEAFCFDRAGNLLWSAKFPLKDGWTKIAAPTGGFSTSAEVTRALSLMGLSLPVTPDQVKSRYRELAKKFHPDLNPNDPQAGVKMRNLSAAAEALTGIEASALPSYTGATFVKNVSQTEIDIGGKKFTLSIQMGGGELFASDWIYAAAFGANSEGAYLAGYSGRVVVMDERGKGVRVYDIGSVPRKIIDTGDYLYLLTDTRLYVLRGDELHALVDTFAGGDLVMAQTGFGLLESKRLRWFGEEGQYLGSVVSKDPIRRVYHSDKGMVVETRQRRAIIHGVPGWW